MQKESIPHDDAMVQEFAFRYEEAEAMKRDLFRYVDALKRENAHLERQVKFLARELADRSYAFTAEDWLDIAKRETRK